MPTPEERRPKRSIAARLLILASERNAYEERRRTDPAMLRHKAAKLRLRAERAEKEGASLLAANILRHRAGMLELAARVA